MADIKSQYEKSNNGYVQDNTISIHLSDVWRGIVKFWWVCLILIIIGGAVMFFRSYERYNPVYRASATFTVQTQNSSSSDESFSFYYNRSTAALLSTTFPYILQSNLLQEAIRTDLGLDSLPVAIGAKTVENTNMFTLTTEGRDPQLVYDILISAIKNYPVVAEYVVGNTQLDMILIPTVPEEPYNAFAYRSSTAKGMAVGLLLGLVWIFIYAISRKTIRKKQDVQPELHQTCIGVIPDVYFKRHRRKIDRRTIITNPQVGTGFLESIRLLRNTITHALSPDERVIMVTSTAPGEGKSTTSVNLAASIAKTEQKVILIDTDVRNSGIQQLIGFDQEKTGTELNGYKVIVSNSQYSIVNVPELMIDVLLIADDGHARNGMIKAGKMKRLTDHLREIYDYVIVDTPPAGLIADASIIAKAVDTVIFVVRQDGVRVSRIRKALDDLLDTDVKILGCVMNGASSGISGYGDNYGYAHYGSKYGTYGKYGYGYNAKKDS